MAKLIKTPNPPNAAGPTAAFASIVDEYGDLEAEFAAMGAKAERLKWLKAEIRAKYDNRPADLAYTGHGQRFDVLVNARPLENSVNVAKLAKTVGARLFAKIASVTLTSMRSLCTPAVCEECTVTEQTGTRRLTPMQKAGAANAVKPPEVADAQDYFGS